MSAPTIVVDEVDVDVGRPEQLHECPVVLLAARSGHVDGRLHLHRETVSRHVLSNKYHANIEAIFIVN